MVEIRDIDENKPWHNDPEAKAAVMAAREWRVHDRKGKEEIRHQQVAVIAYGNAMLKGRKRYSSNNEFKKWVREQELDIDYPFNNPRERSEAMRIAEIVFRTGAEDAECFIECPHKLPSHMMTWARKAGLVSVKKRDLQVHAMARERVRAKVENGDPISRDALAQELNVSEGTIQRADLAERGRLEGIAEGEANVLNAQGKFTKAQAHHVEALARKQERHLNQQFNAAVEARVATRVAERVAALEKAQIACREQREAAFKDQQHWQKLINRHKPIFTVEEFRAIVMALHPDNSASEETRARAMQSVNDKKLQLTGKP